MDPLLIIGVVAVIIILGVIFFAIGGRSQATADAQQVRQSDNIGGDAPTDEYFDPDRSGSIDRTPQEQRVLETQSTRPGMTNMENANSDDDLLQPENRDGINQANTVERR
ncbi:MAG: hypothetical protein HC876_06420 [Chloroflexaceae bacterium]|nr:hypothetical protein [Chloroflexaceae bacterium]NJO05175.1 hypothetical protein [Chloroflexaceae bacterium]